MTTWIVLAVSLLLILMALAAIFSRSLASAIILLSTLSLFTALLFVLVAAPDVAITEAAIGSALTTVVFVLALYRTRNALAADGKSAKNAADESSVALRSSSEGTNA
ncbi:MAG TPA: hydrogenase subunit MbhD domain-containing protein [bacterium]|nr:hydrogenase subunit MbhD domain-containing protein [bacterium]